MSMEFIDSSYRKQCCCGNCANCIRDMPDESGVCELADEDVSIFGYCNKHEYRFDD
jgi:hypothetical protein